MEDQVPRKVAELPGPYGPVTISERLVQRIWSLQALRSRDLSLRDGRKLSIRHPGSWNRSGAGPDFRGAVFDIEGETQCGDVEIHLYAEDWDRHRHPSDTNFDSVRLHVVLFEPKSSTDVGLLPTLVLGPYLTSDIEGCLFGEMETAELGQLYGYWSDTEPRHIRGELLDLARTRWVQKMRFAETRFADSGGDLEEALHLATLEVLGYRRNRAAMSEVAFRFPLAQWRAGGLSVSAVMDGLASRWRHGGQRPANRPVVRLEQYASLWRDHPEWPERLRSLPWPVAGLDASSHVGAFRRELGLSQLREQLVAATGGIVGGTRLDTLVIDAWLPLLAVAQRREYCGCWLAWFSGDFPEPFEQALRLHHVTDGRTNPRCNAWNQGLIELLLRQE